MCILQWIDDNNSARDAEFEFLRKGKRYNKLQASQRGKRAAGIAVDRTRPIGLFIL
jgi:hypothetical protein